MENSNHSSKFPFIARNENERNIREPGEYNLRGISQYTQKLQENKRNFVRRNNKKKYEEYLVGLMATPMKRRKDAETMLGAGKREVFETPRGDNLLQKDHENLSKNQPSAKINDGNLTHSTGSLLDTKITRGLEISNLLSK